MKHTGDGDMVVVVRVVFGFTIFTKEEGKYQK